MCDLEKIFAYADRLCGSAVCVHKFRYIQKGCSNLLWPVALATRIALILANMLMLVLTWAKTFRLKREAMRLNMKMPLSTLLLRDGE